MIGRKMNKSDDEDYRKLDEFNGFDVLWLDEITTYSLLLSILVYVLLTFEKFKKLFKKLLELKT